MTDSLVLHVSEESSFCVQKFLLDMGVRWRSGATYAKDFTFPYLRLDWPCIVAFGDGIRMYAIPPDEVDSVEPDRVIDLREIDYD